MTASRALAAAVAFWCAAGGTAGAHPGGSTAHASVAVQGAAVRYSLTVWPATLPPAVAEDVRLARDGDAARRDRLLGIVRDKVALLAHGQRCRAGAGTLRAPAPDSVTLSVDFACPGPVRDLAMRDDLFDVLGAGHHTLARIDGLGRTQLVALGPDAREIRVRADSAPTGLRTLARFVPLGVEHILTGWDHLLFLLALLLPGGGWPAILKVVTAFTLAHSVTLALAVLEVVTLPERLIEAVIALSIAAAAVENLVRRPTVRRRWIVSLVFGLVHGFGFSSVLREIGLPSASFALALLGFNAGVELGQALVVAVALPAMAAARRAGWEPRLVRGSSIAILVVGLALFLERAFL